MNKFIKKLKTVLIYLSVLTVFSCHNPENVNALLTENGLCDMSKSYCLLNGQLGTIKARFDKRPVTEEELLIHFDVPVELNLTRAQIKGINMSMGIVQIMLDEGHVRRTGTIFLGSCAEPMMAWRVILEVQHKETKEIELLQAGFVTTRGL